ERCHGRSLGLLHIGEGALLLPGTAAGEAEGIAAAPLILIGDFFCSHGEPSIYHWLFVLFRRKSRSSSPRWHKSRSPSPRRRISRSPSLRRHKRRRSRSISGSPINKSESPSLGSIERKTALETQRQEEERKR
ncbi:unnamed protein product, partial [Musa textilis]